MKVPAPRCAVPTHACAAVVGSVTALCLLVAGVPGVASAAVPAPRVSAGHSATAGKRVSVSILVPRDAHGDNAVLLEKRGSRWIVRDGARVKRPAVRLWFKAPPTAQHLLLRIELVRGRHVTWSSSLVRVTIRASASPGEPPATNPVTTPTTPTPPPPTVTTPTGPGDPTPAPPGNTLSVGQTLTPGEFLLSPDGQYELVMQTDGNLVEYQGSSVLWASGTGGDSGAWATMQADGNFVVYQGSTAVWNAQTEGFDGGYVSLQDDSNLVVYSSGHPVWDRLSGYIGNELDTWELQPGAYLLSPNGQYELIMQQDGNLVLYQGGITCNVSCSGDALWDSGTGSPGNYAIMQADGNFVVYQGSTAVWNSQTEAFPGSNIVLQNDSNLVIYDGSTAVWDRLSGLLGGGGGGGPTGAETDAVNWAASQLGSTAWGELCLSFVQTAYDHGGINMENDTSGVTWNSNTDPQDVWGHTTTGTTGTGTPPYGALVFFNADPGYNPEDYSHVTIMGSGGEMISTNDVGGQNVHQETLYQAEHAGAWNTYVGWWLPDG
jgi:hypothetical protein